MTKDYGEILLESMSTLLEANLRSLSESADEAIREREEEEIIANLNTADPLTNFLPNISHEITEAQTINPLTSLNGAVWQIQNYNIKNNLLAINCTISTSRNETATTKNNGTFGIVVGIQTGDKTYATTFDSSEMFGNIYNFKNMPQKLMLSIPEKADVKSIGITCYNHTSDIDFTVNKIVLSLGEDLSVIGPTLDSFTISCSAITPRYTVTDRGDVVENASPNYLLEAKYIGKDEQGNYFAVTPADKLNWTPNLSVRWYRYMPEGVDNPDSWGGMNWLYQEQSVTGADALAFNCTTFSATHEVEQYKAVLVGVDLNSGEPIVLTSNIITIEKETVPTEGYINKIQIQLNDNSNGIYPFYEFDGYVKQNLLTEIAKEREASCIYETVYTEDEELNSQFFAQIDSIDWIYSPWSINRLEDTASLPTTIICQNFIDNDGYTHIHFSNLSGQTQAVIDLLCKFKYSIAPAFPFNNIPSKIACTIGFKDGKTYSANQGITLSQVGSSGTDYTVITRLFNPIGDLVNAVIRGQSNYCVQINIYDKEGKLVDLNTPSLKLRYQNRNLSKTESTSSAMSGVQWYLPALSDSDILDIEISLTSSGAVAVSDNTQAVSRTLKLQEAFAVPVCTSAYANRFYQGPSKVIYNSGGGQPSYNTSFLDLIPKPENETISWKLSTSLTDKSLIPEIAVAGNKYSFTPICTYDAKMLEAPIRIQGLVNGIMIWDQPIIILLDKYFSKIINEWDGSFQINEEGNYIMSSAYVAGGKNEYNAFTGVIMGELGTITETEDSKINRDPKPENATNEEKKAVSYIHRNKIPETNPAMTGLFGYMEGQQSFGFKSDGTAFIGPSGGGRINLDGNGGVIYSGNFDGFEADANGQISVGAGTKGTYFNLQDGKLITANGTFRGELGVDNGNLAGWKLDHNGMYKIRECEADEVIEAEGGGTTEVTRTYKNYAGLSSQTTTPILETKVPFNYTLSDDQYYMLITGERAKKSIWTIPQYINGYKISGLELPSGTNISNYWADSTVETIKFDSDIDSLFIGDNFFKGNKSLNAIYIPASTYYIGSKAFDQTNMNIYLEGKVNPRWAADWNGNNNNVYYARSDIGWDDFEFADLTTVNSAAKSTQVVRFYAGADKASPTLDDWDTAKNNNTGLFLVTDTGELRAMNAEITNLKVNSIPNGYITLGREGQNNTSFGACLGQISMVTTDTGNVLSVPYYQTIYSGHQIQANKNFTISTNKNGLIALSAKGEAADSIAIRLAITTGAKTQYASISYDRLGILSTLLSKFSKDQLTALSALDEEQIEALDKLTADQITALATLSSLSPTLANLSSTQINVLDNLTYTPDQRTALNNLNAAKLSQLGKLGDLSDDQITKLKALLVEEK